MTWNPYPCCQERDMHGGEHCQWPGVPDQERYDREVLTDRLAETRDRRPKAAGR